MKISVTATFFFLAIRFCASAQTGFFLIAETKGNCSHLVKSVDYQNQNEYCITDEPIIKSAEFSVVGQLQYDLLKTTQFFNIRFTKSGYETLKLICDHMPEKQLLFVVTNKAAGIFDSKKLKPSQLMPISGVADSKEIKWVFENVKNAK